LQNLKGASYRFGDHLKKLKHKMIDDGTGAHADLRNIYVEVKGTKKAVRTRAFHAPDDQDEITLNEVLFVPVPPPGEGYTVGVYKLHKLQSDAMIGEAGVTRPSGPVKLKLKRDGNVQGEIRLTVTTGLPPMDMKQASPAPASSSDAGLPPPIRRGSPDGTNAGGSGVSMVSNTTTQSRPAPLMSASASTSTRSTREEPPTANSQQSNAAVQEQTAPQRTASPDVDILGNLLACTADILKGAAQCVCSKGEEKRCIQAGSKH